MDHNFRTPAGCHGIGAMLFCRSNLEITCLNKINIGVLDVQ